MFAGNLKATVNCNVKSIPSKRGRGPTTDVPLLSTLKLRFNPATMSGLSTISSKNAEKKDKRFVALMRPEDIRESVLTTLDIAVTVDELRRPTPALVEQLYTAFLQEIFDVDFDEYMVNMQAQPYFSAVSVS